METVSMHLHLTREAADLLEKYSTKRTRGAFLSELVVAHHRLQKDGDGIVDALRKKAAEASRQAAAAQNALKAAEELQRGSNPQNSPSNGSKKR